LFRLVVQEHEKTFDENNIRDFIDAFIVEKRKSQDASFKVRNTNSCNVFVLHIFTQILQLFKAY